MKLNKKQREEFKSGEVMNYKTNTTDCTKAKISQNVKSTCVHDPDLTFALASNPLQYRCKKCGPI